MIRCAPPLSIRRFATPALLLLVLGAGACGGPEAADEPPTTAAGETTPDPQAVEYEPAYPEEVSDEGLSEEDEAQQAVTHTHDGEAHTHEEGEDGDHDDGSHDH